jgi:hypothetical protein
MTPLQTCTYSLIALLKNPENPGIDAAVVRLWDIARQSDDDESLGALGISLADKVSNMRHFDGSADDAQMALRCFVSADAALTNNP